MWRSVWAQLVHDPKRTAATLLAIASVIAVILVLEGFRTGLGQQLRLSVLHRGAPLIAVQPGVRNLMAARSVLPQLSRAAVEAVPGVKTAHPLTGIPVIVTHRGNKAPLYLFAYDDLGGPHRFVGDLPDASGDIVVDRSFAKAFSLSAGDELDIAGFTFRISGIAEGAAALFTAQAFISYDTLLDFYLNSNAVPDLATFPLLSYLLIETDNGVSLTRLRDDIEAAVPAVDVLDARTLAASDARLGQTLFGAVFALMIAVAYLIGVLVIGMITFAAVTSRRKTLAVMMALGFPASWVGRLVVLETACLTVLAYPLAVGLAQLLAMGIEQLAPLYLIQPAAWRPLLFTGLASLAFALAGACLPAWRIRRVDPASVFRG